MMVGGEGIEKGLFAFIFHFIFSRPYARRMHYVLLQGGLMMGSVGEIIVHVPY